MVLLRMIASGRDSPEMDIISAREVPSGTPFAVIEKTIGAIMEQPA